MTSHARHQHEDAFWKGFIEASAPGWTASVAPSGKGSVGLSGMDSFFYAVDTRHGWVNAAGFPSEQVLKIIDKVQGLETSPGMLATHAISKITELSEAGVGQDSAEARAAMISTIGALSRTQTMQAVLDQRGSLKGSFIYLVYSPSRGMPFARPLFALPDEEGFLPLNFLFEVVGEWMRRDMYTPGSSTFNAIQSSGPLLVCDGLKDIIGR